MSPPLHPMLPKLLLQSTSCCSEIGTRWPVAISQAPSSAPVALKDQQLPHCAWFFTLVTAPFFTQSTSVGSASPLYSCVPRCAASPYCAVRLGLKPVRNV